jgi:hypothetical protein
MGTSRRLLNCASVSSWGSHATTSTFTQQQQHRGSYSPRHPLIMPCSVGGVVSEDTLGPAEPESAPAVPAPRAQPTMVRRVIDADNSCLFNAIG